MSTPRTVRRLALAGLALLTGGVVPIFLLLTATGRVLLERPEGMLAQQKLLQQTARRYRQRLLIPSLLVFGATWLLSLPCFPALAKRIQAGLLAGIAGTIALDLVRLTGYRMGWLPANMPITFGRMLGGMLAPKREVITAGYAYHLLNGIDFGLVYSIVAGPAAWFWGVVWALLVGTGMAVSPPVLMTGSGIGFLRKGLKPLAIIAAAHLAMGIALGLVSHALGGPRGTIVQLARRVPASE